MEAKAKANSVRISTRKVRLVAKLLSGLSANQGLNVLSQVQKRGGYPLLKTLKSAVANAKVKGLNMDNLIIKSVQVGEAGALKRYHPSTRGRVHPYKRRASHIEIILADNQSQISNLKSQIGKKKEENGTKS